MVWKSTAMNLLTYYQLILVTLLIVQHFCRVLVDRVNELERRLVDSSGQGGSCGREGSQTGAVASYTDLPLAARELMEGYTPPAGRGGLACVKELDASHDPRVAKFLESLTAPHPPSQTRDAGDGEAQLNGTVGNGDERNMIAEMETKCVERKDLTHMHNGMSGDETIHNNQTSEEDEVCGSDAGPVKEEDTGEDDEKEHSPLLPDVHCSQASTDDALEEIVPLDQLDAYIKEVHMNRSSTNQRGKKETKKGVSEEEKRCVKEKKVKEEEKRAVKEKKGRKAEEEVVEKGRTEIEPKQEIDAQKRVDRRERKEVRSQREPDEDKSGVEVQEEVTGTHEQKKAEKVQENKMLTTEKVDDKNSEKDYDDESFDLDLSDYDSDNDKLDLALEEWRNDCGGKLVGEPTSPMKGGNKKPKGGKKEGFRLWRKEPKEGADDVELPSALQALLDKATAAASMDGGSDGNSGWTM